MVLASFSILLQTSSLCIIICVSNPEPISGTAPNIALMLKFGRYSVNIAGDTALLCPAQTFPVPNYRYVVKKFVFPRHRLGLQLAT